MDKRVHRSYYNKLLELDAAWEDQPRRLQLIEECRARLAGQTEDPRLAALARLLTPALDRRAFWSVLVPVERSLARLRVTDSAILDADLPAAAAPAPDLPLTVVLDSFRSAFNVGGIFRTAECFGIRELVLCGYTSTPENPQVAAASLGTEKRVPWRAVGDIHAALAELKSKGVPCIALETVKDAPAVADYAWPFPCALVLGNERFGLDANVLADCRAAVRIPLFGAKNSLNVVSAFSIAAYEIRRRYNPCLGGAKECSRTR